jgi:FkbM family methyltransferase
MAWGKRGLKRAYAALPFKQPLFTALRNVVNVPERIHRHLHFQGIIQVPVSATEHFRMRHHGHMIENELFWKGIKGWEPVSMELWLRLCRGSRNIFDIGANTGVYALAAQAVNPDANVVAVEPVERIFRKLQDNILLNGDRIRAVHAAVSDHSGTALLYDMPEADHVLSVSLEASWNSESDRLRPVEVPCITVADLAHETGTSAIDLVKIDVETHEPAVLRGFERILERDAPSMLIEILNEEVARQVAQLIAGLGYRYYNIDDRTWPPPAVDRLTASGHFNFLICRPEVAATIGL